MVKPAPNSTASTPLLLVLAALHLMATSAGSMPAISTDVCNNSNGTYQQKVGSLFAQMTMTDISFGFYNSSLGQAPDVAYLMALCLGNIPMTDCRTCLSIVAEQINSLCPTQKNVIIWSDECMLRYSKDPIIGKLEEMPVGALGNGTYLSKETKYVQLVQKLLRSLPSKASAGNSSIKFAHAHTNYNSSITTFSAAQCTPGLPHQDCLQCLTHAVASTETTSSGHRGPRYDSPSCYVQYEDFNFNSSSPTSTNGTRSSKRTMKVIVAAVAGSLCLLLITAATSFIFIRKRELYQNLHNKKFIDGDDISNIESFHFKFSTAREATGNFSEDNKLGEGGFGAVYKGRLPGNGQEIAVKRLRGNSSQGEAEFKTEITLLAKLQHKNLVRLLGFCSHNKERLLIYEFVSNGSLDHFIFDASRRGYLDWEIRYNLIRGIARGILYLQEDSRLLIVHRDLKASNILLNAEMCPKIADFGTARLFDIHQTHSETTRIVGTYGYMAPEYALHGNFSTKSDVYSFGILVLEIVCGKRCNTLFDGEMSGNLISLVWRKWNEGSPLEVVDSGISDSSEAEILRCIHIGLLCVQERVADRPTISSVLRMMSSESPLLPLPLQPSYTMASNIPLNFEDSMTLYSEDVSRSIDRSIELESITKLNV